MERYRKCSVVCALFVLLSICDYTGGHPQCLDSRPPFQAEATLSFCPEYSDFGCCTVQDDTNLQLRYTNIKNRLPLNRSSLWTSCSDRVQTLLCQRCSPYAAHIFDSETTQIGNFIQPRAFPGLCTGYCMDFFSVCQDVIEYYMAEFGSTHPNEKSALLSYMRQGSQVFCSRTSLTDMDYCYPNLRSNPILNGNISIETVTKEGCICVEQLPGVQLRNPIFLKHANDGSNRLFIGEQIGLVHIFYRDGTKLPEPFLNIMELIHTTNYKGDERGMLGMEMHPDYTQNGKFYIYYSTYLNEAEMNLTSDHKIRVEEFRVDPNNPNVADVTYHRTIIEIYEPWWNHNGGEIMFGDDGYLYLFVGDGGKAGDPLQSGQNLTSLLGKVLRIDVDTYSPGFQYSIPADNPFANGQFGRAEIYAYGVRNIWRCGKDRGDPITGYGKGRIVCGDVGQSNREELNLLEKGVNYGWNLKEGTANYCGTSQCNLERYTKNLTAPIFDYPHSVGKSVTGGNFYRGCHSPNFNGFYIYGDFMSGRLFRLLEDPVTKQWNNKELNMCRLDRCTPPLYNQYATSIISFGEDEDGEIYMLSTGFASTEVAQGAVYRLVDPSRRGNPATCRSAQVNTPTTPVPVTTTTTKTTTTKTTTTPTQAPTTTPTKTSTPTTGTSSGTTEKDTSGAVIPTLTGHRLHYYIDYYRRLQLRNRRRRLQQKFREERERRHRNLVGYKITPPPRNPAGHITMRGISVRRCTSKPKIWCSLNRFIP